MFQCVLCCSVCLSSSSFGVLSNFERCSFVFMFSPLRPISPSTQSVEYNQSFSSGTLNIKKKTVNLNASVSCAFPPISIAFYKITFFRSRATAADVLQILLLISQLIII